MRRGTTPTNVFDVNIDLTGASAVYVTYEQGGEVVLEKTGTDLAVEPDSITVARTQEDTLKLKPGKVFIQIRYILPDGTADASDVIAATVDRVIKDGVIGE